MYIIISRELNKAGNQSSTNQGDIIMAKKFNLGSLILATSSFIGGFAIGMLLAPNKGSKNRAWLSDQATELSDWMDHRRRAVSYQTNKKIKVLRKNMNRGVRQHIPNLYDATENINLSDRDVFGA